MKNLLLAGALLLIPATAHAQAAVVCVNCATIYNQIAQFAQEIANLENQLQQQIAIYNNLTRALDPNNVASELLSQQQPFSNPGQLTQVFSQWHTGPMNYPGSGAFLPDNQTYNVPGNDWQASELNSNSQGLANTQAVMSQQVQSINAHIAGLQDLRSQLSGVTSQADLTALNGRIQAETSDIASQGVQMQALQSQVIAEQSTMQQRELQQTRQSDDALANSSAFQNLPGASVPTTNPSLVAAN